jgi:Tol biopolymer transport system component
MQTRQTTTPRRTSSTRQASRRLSLWLGLALGISLALGGCSGLSNSGDQFHTVPGTKSSGTSALAVNVDSHFQGHIAFVRSHQLYTLSGKDGTVRALATGTTVQDPAYAPDGSRLAYIRRGASWSDLMVIPTAGGQPIALTHNQGTGQQIACPDGISEGDSIWAANPTWAPDGSTLYYLSDAQKLSKASCGFLDMAVWKLPAQGGNAQLVLWPARGSDNTGTPGAGGDADLSLRPGSSNALSYTHYAYDAGPGGRLLVQIFLAPIEQHQQAITPNQQQETALAPAMNAQGTPQETLEGSWSPNGQYLAYILRTADTQSLMVMRVSAPARGAPDFQDFANSTNLLNGAISYPIWSPDGKSLLYMQFKNNEFNLYLAQLTFSGSTISLQGSPIQLTQGGIDGDSRPAWTGA